jgi:hypothetical protein
MKVSTAVRGIGGEHVHFALFLNNGKAGDLTLRISEYNWLKTVLEVGSHSTQARIEMAPLLDPTELEALERLEGAVAETGVYEGPKTSDIVHDEHWEEFAQDLSILCSLVRRSFRENQSDATEDEHAQGGSEFESLGRHREDAQQQQGNGDDKSPDRDRGSEASPDSGRVGEDRGDTLLFPSIDPVLPVHEAVAGTTSPAGRLDTLGVHAGGTENPPTSGGPAQLDGAQEQRLVIPSLVCETCGATKRPVLLGGFICPRCQK